MAATKLYNLLCCNQTCSKVYLHNGSPRSIFNPLNVSLSNHKIKKIMSWNIQELFWYSNRTKMEKIIQYIKQSNCDLICLQEVFEISSLERILYDKDILQKYPFSITGNMKSKYIFGENSGLLVLSTQPIQYIKFEPLMPYEFPDSMASKGIIYFRIGVHNFAATHLQAFNEALAEQQLRLVRDSSPFGLDFILIGDLNHRHADLCLHCKKNNYQRTSENQILDYILCLNPNSRFKLKVEVADISIKGMTDHWPLIADLHN